MHAPFNVETVSTHTADIIKLLGHPVRLGILSMIAQNRCTVREIWESLGLQQSTVSQQLAIMKNCGIIAGQRVGVRMFYRIIHPLAQRIITELI